MSISPHMFRNVETTPDDPMDEWPHEVVRAAIEYGMISDWAVIANEVRRAPWGEFARTVAETLEFVDPCPAATILRRVLLRARGQLPDRPPPPTRLVLS